MPNFIIVRVQTSEITHNKETDRQTDKQTDAQTDNAIYYNYMKSSLIYNNAFEHDYYMVFYNVLFPIR